MVKPGHKKAAVQALKLRGMSERRSCSFMRISRSGYRKPQTKKSDEEDMKMLRALAESFPRSGYEQLFQIYRNDGGRMNHKRFYRLYKAGNFSLRRTKRRQKITRERVPLQEAKRVGETWSMDFQFDSTIEGRRLKLFNIVDDFSKDNIWIEVDTSIGSEKVISILENVILINGKPDSIRTDNGPEFTSKRFILWTREKRIRHFLIQPGKPNQNAFIESFNSRLRHECLQANIFKNLEHAREVIEEWRDFYNHVRPHKSLNGMPPKKFISLTQGVLT